MLWVLNSLTASSYYSSFLGICWRLYILHSIQCYGSAAISFFKRHDYLICLFRSCIHSNIDQNLLLCVWLNLIISSCPALVDSSCWFKALRWRQQCTRKSGSTLDLVQKHHFTTGTGTRRTLFFWKIRITGKWGFVVHLEFGNRWQKRGIVRTFLFSGLR